MNEHAEELLRRSRTLGLNALATLLESYGETLNTMPASVKHHHVEQGGWARHSLEVAINAAYLARNWLTGLTEARLFQLCVVHDLDKLERYEVDPEPPTEAQLKYARGLGVVIDKFDSKTSMSTKIDNAKNNLNNPIHLFRYRQDLLPTDESALVVSKLADFGIALTPEELHALCCHHGGWSAVMKERGHGSMSTLAVVLHAADMLSVAADKEAR